MTLTANRPQFSGIIKLPRTNSIELEQEYERGDGPYIRSAIRNLKSRMLPPEHGVVFYALDGKTGLINGMDRESLYDLGLIIGTPRTGTKGIGTKDGYAAVTFRNYDHPDVPDERRQAMREFIRTSETTLSDHNPENFRNWRKQFLA